jgi:hypothetical protein
MLPDPEYLKAKIAALYDQTRVQTAKRLNEVGTTFIKAGAFRSGRHRVAILEEMRSSVETGQHRIAAFLIDVDANKDEATLQTFLQSAGGSLTTPSTVMPRSCSAAQLLVTTSHQASETK